MTADSERGKPQKKANRCFSFFPNEKMARQHSFSIDQAFFSFSLETKKIQNMASAALKVCFLTLSAPRYESISDLSSHSPFSLLTKNSNTTPRRQRRRRQRRFRLGRRSPLLRSPDLPPALPALRHPPLLLRAPGSLLARRVLPPCARRR